MAVLTLPAQVLILAVAWAASGEWPIVRQRRVGLRGSEFFLLKVRTMRGPDVSSQNTLERQHCEFEISRPCAILRRTTLDEILQFWNVAAGHMSLIGPRPWVPTEQAMVEEIFAEARNRLKMRPGMIGWAAAQLARPRGACEYLTHVRADLHYLAKATPALDLEILGLALRSLAARLRRE